MAAARASSIRSRSALARRRAAQATAHAAPSAASANMISTARVPEPASSGGGGTASSAARITRSTGLATAPTPPARSRRVMSAGERGPTAITGRPGAVTTRVVSSSVTASARRRA